MRGLKHTINTFLKVLFIFIFVLFLSFFATGSFDPTTWGEAQQFINTVLFTLLCVISLIFD